MHPDSGNPKWQKFEWNLQLIRSVSDISCNVVASMPFSVRKPKPDECFHILRSKWHLKIQLVSSVSTYATETLRLATSVYRQFNVASQQCHKTNLKLQWEVVRNTVFCALCIFMLGGKNIQLLSISDFWLWRTLVENAPLEEPKNLCKPSYSLSFWLLKLLEAIVCRSSPFLLAEVR